MKDAKSMEKEVCALAKPGGRMVGTPGHDEAREYVVGRMRDMGLEPYDGDSFELPYHSSGTDFANIAGTVKSTRPEKAPVLIGAHYDSVIPHECADDNAAAVIIALAVAEELLAKKDDLERDVTIAIFDAEEPPYFHGQSMGSIRFYEDQMDERGTHCAIIMDLVGHDVKMPADMLKGLGIPNLFRKDEFGLVSPPIIKDLLFATGAESASEMPSVCESASLKKGLRVVNVLNSYVGDMSDHHVFRMNGVPYLFLSCGRWTHYHSETDTPKVLNYKKMVKIAKYLSALCESASKTELTAETEIDTAAFECETIKKAFSPFTSQILKTLGLKNLESRSDVDALARTLMSTGL